MEPVGAGREAEILPWGDGRVLRLFRTPRTDGVVERELAALRAAAEGGVPVPKVYDRVEVEGRPGIVMERLGGEDLLLRVSRRPWTARAVGTRLGVLHARIHAIEGPAELPALGDGDRLCHGDFHPANVLEGRVIDWTVATRGDPAADVARTCLLLAVAQGPGTRPAWQRLGELVVRWHLADAYLHAYGADRAAVERWVPELAAARLDDDFEEERVATVRLAEAGTRLRLPRRYGIEPEQRRWILLNAIVITAILNLLINAGLAWATTDGRVPFWSAPIVGGPSTLTDTVGTFFLLPLITTVLVTSAVRGRFGGQRVDLVFALPHNVVLRGALLGAFCVAVLTPLFVPPLALIGEMSRDAFVAYKGALGVAFGLVVTPFVALAAMNDVRSAEPSRSAP